ncbi:hypothetical protein BD769DRAFT_1360459, partial [Suillus cothurnatus]
HLNNAAKHFQLVLDQCPVGHPYQAATLTNLAWAALKAIFKTMFKTSLILSGAIASMCSLGNPSRHSTLNNLALRTRYVKLNTSGDLDEAINLFRDWLRLALHGHPGPHRHLRNLSSALCSRFTQTRKNEDIEEAIPLCQESLEALPSLNPSRCFSYVWLHLIIVRVYLESGPTFLT